MPKCGVLFDKLGILGYTVVGAYVSGFVYLLADRPDTVSQWLFSLNFSGLILEIIGATVGAYTIREILVGGGFTPTAFTGSGFTTGNPQVRINKVAGAISAALIIIGLWLQLFGVVVSQIDTKG